MRGAETVSNKFEVGFDQTVIDRLGLLRQGLVNPALNQSGAGGLTLDNKRHARRGATTA